ncbi:hypothetical protein GGI1_05311 [Acidithiobacillus sp. GGI-221]|nr:hypothetical protein GGI1_05311 [Acidithiobacillus sp. GGI-221]
MRIAIDADQVLFDFDGAWRTTAETVLNRELPKRNESYHLMARYSLSMAEYHKCWAMFHALEMWRHCPVIPDALDAVHGWLDMGNEVFVISAVDTPARKLRQQAMDDLGLRRACLMAVGSKGSKYHALKGLRPGFFADDLWKHCREAIDAGVPHVVRVSGGHDGDGDPVPGVRVVDSIGGFCGERFDRKVANAR